jgi:hypothetical protein
LISFGLVIVIVGFIVASDKALVRYGRVSAELRRGIREIEASRAVIARKVQDLERSIADAEETAAYLEEEASDLERDALAADAAAERLEASPRDGIYVADRKLARPGQLWEVAVTHEGLARHPVGEYARSWSAGRRYVILAETEKLAHQRAEMRFPASQGYRMAGVKPAAF